jgi:hypothetical protein
MNRVLIVLSASALLLLSASCEKEKSADPAATTAAATAAATAPANAAAPAAALANQNIPVAADFEEEAEKSITLANYKAELDSLEAEIK